MLFNRSYDSHLFGVGSVELFLYSGQACVFHVSRLQWPAQAVTIHRRRECRYCLWFLLQNIWWWSMIYNGSDIQCYVTLTIHLRTTRAIWYAISCRLLIGIFHNFPDIAYSALNHMWQCFEFYIVIIGSLWASFSLGLMNLTVCPIV